MTAVDFNTWNQHQLTEYVGFVTGRDLRGAQQADLCAEAKQLHAADPQHLVRFGDFIRGGGKVAIEGRSAQPAYGVPQYGAPPASFYGAVPAQPHGAPTYGQPMYGAYPPPQYPPSGLFPGAPGGAYPQPGYPPAQGSGPGAAPAYPAYPAPHGADKAAVPAQGQPAVAQYGQPMPSQNGGPPPQQHAYAAAQASAPPPPRHNQLLAQPERRRKALLIGCNYPGTRAELRGCVNDALCMEYLLKTKFGFRPENIRILRDDAKGGRHPGIMPTRANIMSNIQWLVAGNQPNDSLFFHFSGHGSQQRDRTGREADGMNETICPCDFERAGQIVDDQLAAALVRPVVRGATMHAVIDACHSGTALDLPFVTKLDKRTRKLGWIMDSRPHAHAAQGGLAVQFGACSDSQTAADTSALSGGTHTGAATFLFIQAIEHLSAAGAHNITYAQVIAQMLTEVDKVNGPRVSGGGPLDMLLGKLGGGGALGSLIGGLTGAGMVGGQTPQLSASENFNLNLSMLL